MVRKRFVGERFADALRAAVGEPVEISPTFVPIHREDHARAPVYGPPRT